MKYKPLQAVAIFFTSFNRDVGHTPFPPHWISNHRVNAECRSIWKGRKMSRKTKHTGIKSTYWKILTNIYNGTWQIFVFFQNLPPTLPVGNGKLYTLTKPPLLAALSDCGKNYTKYIRQGRRLLR